MREIDRGSTANRRHGTGWPGIRAPMLAAATLLATTVLASTTPFVTPVAARQGQQQGQGSVTVDEILESPRQYYGQRVTITGEVGDILSSRSFVVRAGAMAPGAETMVPGAETTAVGEIPVVAARPLVGPDGRALGPTDLMERVVRVTGTVHQFNIRAFEDRLGIDLPDTSLSAFAGRPAIIASQVVPVLSERASSVQQNGADGTRSGAAGRPARAQPSQGRQQQQDGDVTIADILDNPRQYIGRRVTITGSLGQVLGPRSFAMMDGDLVFGDDVAVVARQPITDQQGRRSTSSTSPRSRTNSASTWTTTPGTATPGTRPSSPPASPRSWRPSNRARTSVRGRAARLKRGSRGRRISRPGAAR